jgi:prepilin-type N-terminal cleavage/methylation domain-containing protein
VKKGYTLVEILIGICIFAIVIGFLFIVPLWTDRTLDFWLSYFKGSQINVPYWISFLVTVILNAVILAINIISELLRLVITK